MKPNNLGMDKLSKLIIKLAIPSMIAQVVNVLYGIVDRIFINQIPVIGDLALAGIGVCAPIVTLITSFSFLFGMGGAPLAAMKMGEKDNETAQKIMNNAFGMLLILSAVLTVVFLIIKKPILLAFGASENTLQYANEYLSIYVVGSVFALVSLGLNNFIICQGYSKQAMITVVIGAMTNIVLDPIFIFVFKMGVFGAGLATIIAQCMSCVWVLCFLKGKNSILKLKLEKISLKIIKRIVGIGLSPFIIMMTESVAIIALNATLQNYGGDLFVTAGTIVVSFIQLITGPMAGITSGCQPVLSFNYGARNDKRVKNAFFGILITCVVYGALMMILSFSVPDLFVTIFTKNPEIHKIAVYGIRAFGVCLLFLGVQYACVDNMVALGASGVSVSLSLTRKLGLVIPLTLILPKFFGTKAIFFAEPIAFTVGCVLSSITVLLVFNKLLRKHRKIL